LEAAPDAMVIVNQAGEIVLLNLQTEKLFGYHRDELIGQQVKNIISEGFAERLIADGTRTAAQALAQQIGTGIELNGPRKGGSGLPADVPTKEKIVWHIVNEAAKRAGITKHVSLHSLRHCFATSLLEAPTY
jgi:PAS domain S-box-containing protein